MNRQSKEMGRLVAAKDPSVDARRAELAELRPRWEVAADLGIFDAERAAKLRGTGRRYRPENVEQEFAELLADAERTLTGAHLRP